MRIGSTCNSKCLLFLNVDAAFQCRIIRQHFAWTTAGDRQPNILFLRYKSLRIQRKIIIVQFLQTIHVILFVTEICTAVLNCALQNIGITAISKLHNVLSTVLLYCQYDNIV